MRRAMLHGVSISGTAAEELANESVAELLSAAVLPNLAGARCPRSAGSKSIPSRSHHEGWDNPCRSHHDRGIIPSDPIGRVGFTMGSHGISVRKSFRSW